ncbi:MAG: protein kinase domain-containing protein [Terriglobia bacterium]
MSSLNTDRWQALSPYLDAALEMADEELAKWLASLRAQDAALAAQLEELLQEHRAVAQEHFLEQGPALPLRSQPALTGQNVGAYTLVSPIGQGGMGTVWLARRSDGRFERQAAVKFVNVALTGSATEERFKREGSLLGRLAHPHIAGLLDAGICSDGTPYLILEYVDGVAIDQYCDQHKVDVEGRVKLFRDVLGAVAEAHAHLIVHRDIKPSNVLVRKDGQVKLLDFGIAKLLAREGGTALPTLLTMEGGGAMTPQFAAPEQVTGGTVITATDVYALGVLLYLLLTGQHPAGASVLSPADLVKAIVELEAPRASKIALAESTAAEKRNATPTKLSRQLSGDLDTILDKALKKNPQERYSSVTAFADDLQRYLQRETISVRPDTFAYSAAKFLRRNRTVVALTATAITLVIGSLSIGLLVANRERKIAEQRFAQVRQLANKFIALDNEIRGLPGSTKVRMQLVSDSLQYLRSLGSDIHGDKDLALDIAMAYVRVAHAQGDPTSPNLGQFSEAEANLDRAETFVDSVLIADPTNTRGLGNAAMIAHDHMNIADEQNRREDMVGWADKTSERIERYRRLGNIPSQDIYSVGYFELNVAYCYDDARHFEAAVRAGQRALEIIQPVPSAQRAQGSILGALAIARWQTGDLDGALSTAQKAIALEEAQAAGGHASLRVNLANALYTEGMILGKQDGEPSLGRTREALAALQRGFDIGEELAKMDPIDYLSRRTVAMHGLEIGNILRHSQPQKALAVYDHALARIQEARTNVSTQLYAADLLAGSSYAARWAGRDKDARRRIEEALRLLRDAHQYPADTVEPMGRADHVLRASADEYAETGQTAQAIAAYRELLDKLIAWKPDLQNDLRDATCISRTWTTLGALLRRTGQAAEADRLEAQRAELWNHWNGELPKAQLLLRQSLAQVTPHPAHFRTLHP